MRRIDDYAIGYQGNDETAQCGKCGSDMEPVRPGKWQCPKCELEEMIQHAHRAGWEQAKAEAAEIAIEQRHKASSIAAQTRAKVIASTIAAMEYKEPTDDR